MGRSLDLRGPRSRPFVRRGPHSRPLPPNPDLPAAWQLVRWVHDPLALLDECAARLGDAFTLDLWKLGPMTVVFSRPDVVREIFLASADDLWAGEASALLAPFVGESSVFVLDGARHAQHRRFIVPAFHADRVRAHFDLMVEVTRRVMSEWPARRRFSLHESMKEITLEVIVRAIFGEVGAAQLASLRRKAHDLIEIAARPWFLVPPLRIELGGYSPWGRVMSFLRDFDAFVYGEIARCRAGGTEGRSDLLALLVGMRDERSVGMTDRELRDAIITLLIGGNDTTASTLAWAFHEILRHPGVLAGLSAELDQVAGAGPLAVSHLPALELLDAVVKETFRLHPVVPNALRVAKRPVRIGGWDLPEGAEIAPCIYLTHRRPDLYPDPDRFVPHRFLGQKTDPYELYPFGGGARHCPGRAFAVEEIKIVIAEVLLHANLRPVTTGPVRAVRRSTTVAPAGGVPVVLEGRPR